MDATACTRSSSAARAAAGFTLIELAIAMFVIALLLGSILVPLVTQVEQRQISETQKALEEIKEALIGFAVAKGHLPCPDRTAGGGGGANDTANDGVEDFNAGTGTCNNVSGTPTRVWGNVPWVTLGLSVAASDVWGNRFRYALDPDFAQRAPAVLFTLASQADLQVCATTDCVVSHTSLAAGEGAVAVILSLGKNGLSAINANTGVANPNPPAGSDEAQNIDGRTYVSRTKTGAGSTAEEFDDVVTWLSKYSLFHQMVAAGKLP
jgi:prepilin-type N-terminal cleavage/methylation domain-containing protein